MAIEHKLTFTLLSDGADGVVRVKRSWWHEIVYHFPRGAYKEVASVEELKNSGIYFLLGEKEGKPAVYVGQSTNLSDRFTQHARDASKDFWQETLALTTTGDATLNVAHLNYLENHFHELALAAGRCHVINSMVPPEGTGVEAIRQDMADCISHTRTLLKLMGFRFLEPLAVVPQPEKTPALPVAAEKMPEMPEPPQRLAGDVTEIPPSKPRASKYNFYVMGLHDGDVLVYEDKVPAHRTEAVVCGPDKILVNGEVMTPHALAKRLRQTNNVYAFAYLSWKGEKLCNIYNRIYHPDMGQGAENEKNLRYFTVAGADAVGRLTDDGCITVLKGSRICAETKKSCAPSAVALREEVGASLITQKDYRFTSLSGAAAFVGGCALNGKLCWTETKKLPKPRRK